jgi:hypothetical protein
MSELTPQEVARLAELSAISQSLRTKAERAEFAQLRVRQTPEQAREAKIADAERVREYNRQAKRDQRERERNAEDAGESSTASEFQAKNRASLLKTELAAKLELHEAVLDQVHFMETAQPGDEFFAEDVADLREFIEEHGVVHCGYFRRDPDVPPNWSSLDWWRDSHLLPKCLAEFGDWARYGLLSGVPDWIALNFFLALAKNQAGPITTHDTFDDVAKSIGLTQQDWNSASWATGMWHY